MQSVKILGVRVDKVEMRQALEIIKSWLKSSGKHIIVTPNVEIIMTAQKDREFKEILNRADLAIADSARFSWALDQISKKNLLQKIFHWPTFFLPNISNSNILPVLTGTDLMENLCQLANQTGLKIGLLGGKKGVAEKLTECLKKKFKYIKLYYVNGEVRVDFSGQVVFPEDFTGKEIPQLDILFVALGQVKQEKWINKYKDRVGAKVFIGVGGAFDYLSGKVPRAPLALRKIGLEWLFRLIIQPWRIKRFGSLVKFVFSIF